MIGKVIKTGLLVLLGIGVLRGVIHYNNDQDGEGIVRLASAIINAAEDITYRWLPALVGLIADAGESLSGSGSN
ncbi:MAG: hypothetical protein L0H93_18835 [Nocardioides sp.]|nr:hypothetical protein [Nocardioides sp.]